MTTRTPTKAAAPPLRPVSPPRIPTHLAGCPVVAIVPARAGADFLAVCEASGQAAHQYACWRAYWVPSDQAWHAESGFYTDHLSEALASMLERAAILRR